jgi:hypothetical protein
MRAGFWWGELRKREYLYDLVLDERTMLKLILNRTVRRMWTAISGSSWLSGKLL